MKKLVLIIQILFFSVSTYGQKSDSNSQKILEITNIVKTIDSVANQKNEGIIEGIIKYSHGKNRTFGWEAYFLKDDNNKKNPLRIRYGETKPKEIENLDLYYYNGILIFAELKTTSFDKKIKPLKEIIEKYYFEQGKIINPGNATDSNIDYILEKEKLIVKNIYK